MNWKEIFSWYWEQKGVENPERFLGDEDGENLDSEILSLLSGLLVENNSESTDVINIENNEISNGTPIEEKTLEKMEE